MISHKKIKVFEDTCPFFVIFEDVKKSLYHLKIHEL